ncbi:MAG: class I SAM-dependent methyltransferase [Parvibaculum sp.]|nr:class I SAM-dependent methyltransferase [Parvibaculum sp.]
MACEGTVFEPAGNYRGYDLYHCVNCGFRFTHPIPGAAEIAAVYEKYNKSGKYTAKADRKVVRAKKRIRRYMKLAPGKRFLDVGCSVGSAVEAARQLGFEAYGIDIGAESIEIAREIFPGGHYHAGPIESLPPEWGDFDFVYSAEVIEHLPDPHAYFRSLSPRIKKGGLLYVTTPDAGHWLVPKDFSKWSAVYPPEHLLFFTKEALRRFLDRHGFDTIKVVWSPLKHHLKVLTRKR